MKSYTLIEVTEGFDFGGAGASSLNDNGDVLFAMVGPSGGSNRLFVWKRGNFTEVVNKNPRGRGWNCWGWFMNDACEVVGSVGPGYENQDPYYWKNGQMFILPSVGEEITYAVGINNSGLIVGTTLYPICGILWKDGKIIDTGRSVAQHENHFVSINDRGDIVGYDRINGRSRTFIYSGKSVQYLPSNLDCRPTRINNHKHVVGSVDSKDYRKETAFLFRATGQYPGACSASGYPG